MKVSHLLLLAGLSAATLACGNRNDAMDNVTENANKLDPSEAMANMEPQTSGDITLTPMPATKDFPDAAITDWTYSGGKFNYAATGYEFGVQTDDAGQIMCANSVKGQHAHLIIDNEPYIAKYTPEFEQEVADGNHYILSFLSRSYHESIKTEAAHRAVRTDVKNGAFVNPTDITEPMLFYSRPKGKYVGENDTKNIMLDFYPLNVELSEGGYHVKATVNGKAEFDITSWQPYFLSGLPMGENTVELTLMKGSEMVKAPLNPVTRTFTLEALPTESK
ncbi:hypothetical protein [Lewinella sp. 4G2]|uniref:hypothetical protein n=1 Tax=Lewinella sp. 4G2 TaxID=1803372 RepID=UPI0007B4B1CA|nr:hypothetical protein [Lewinella sp. 4G2]OAV45637.1 hypothetical protein A3850_014545 [Lewinella sp. 4G2]